MHDEAQVARSQSYRDNMAPCQGCPLYELPELHPVTELAIRVYNQLEGGDLGREMYRLEENVLTEDQYYHLFVPVMSEWRSIVREEAKKEAARKQKELEQKLNSP